jgi:hypothetical protein
MTRYFADIRPELARTDESDIIYRFLHRPPVPVALLPGRPAYTTLIGHLAYSVLPGWAQRLHGRAGYPDPVATLMLRTFRRAALGVPTRLRWGKPEPYALDAIERLGRSATPSVRRLPAC